MASRIDDLLWSWHQNRRHLGPSSTPRDYEGRFQATSGTLGSTPMEIDAINSKPPFARTATDCLEYQRQEKCWGCGKQGHIRAKCPTNPSKPLMLAILEEARKSRDSEKDMARD
jgi:hypothetical protein